MASSSTFTVALAFAVNLLIAIAKSIAAFLTGSASMVAEAAHSWADTGNEVFLLVADRKGQAGPTKEHPLGFGRESYVWSMFAALGLFTAGAAVSIQHGIQELLDPEPGGDFVVAYVVLAVSFLLEGTSFLQAFRQTRAEAARSDRAVLEHALRTSDSTLRAVFAEDSAALIGLVIAAVGIALHQVTGSPVPDAIGSIAVGVLLGVIAVVLIDRNRRFLVGQAVSPRMRVDLIERLMEFPEVDRVTYLFMEFVGPRQTYVVASIDIVGESRESQVADTLRELERRLEQDDVVVEAILTVASKSEPSIDH